MELGNNLSSSPEVLLQAKESKKVRRKGDIRSGAMKKSSNFGVIEGRRSEEMIQPNISFPWRPKVSFESQRG